MHITYSGFIISELCYSEQLAVLDLYYVKSRDRFDLCPSPERRGELRLVGLSVVGTVCGS